MKVIAVIPVKHLKLSEVRMWNSAHQQCGLSVRTDCPLCGQSGALNCDHLSQLLWHFPPGRLFLGGGRVGLLLPGL